MGAATLAGAAVPAVPQLWQPPWGRRAPVFGIPIWSLASSRDQVWTLMGNVNVVSFRSEKGSAVFSGDFPSLLDLRDSHDLSQPVGRI